MAAPIYVVVMSTGGAPTEANPKGGPIVMETDLACATLEHANIRAVSLEKHWGARRIGRVIFEDEPGFEVKS